MIYDNFLHFLKKVENGNKVGWNVAEQVWYPHASPEGGNDTIGYGHKLLDDEVEMANKGLSETAITQMFMDDVDNATQVARRVMKSYFNQDFDSLSDNGKCMIIDFAYNLGGGGLKKFPKFVKAVCDDDLEGMRQQYKRYYSANGTKKELKQRNELFYALFLS